MAQNRRGARGRCLVECFEAETNTSPQTKVCRFQSIIGRALEAFLSVLDGYTISDLVADRENLREAMGLTDAVPA
ncbi:MAG: hypothetical protein ABID63_10035 [Pseudomonadota bacterium]